MRRKREHIYIFRLNVNFNMPCRLHRVGMEQHTLFTTYPAYFGNGLNRAYFVIGVHYCYKRGIGANCGFKLVNTHKSVAVNR